MFNKIILLSAIALASFSLTPFRQFKQVNHVKQKVSQSQQELSLAEECDSLIVSLKQSASEVNKKCNNLISLFGESKIKDLTRIDDDVKEQFLNKNYTQMFKISLEPNQRNSIDSIIERVKKIPEVEYVERNQSIPVCSTPNDPYYTNQSQWGLNGTYGINAPEVRSECTGSSLIKVAIVDTGIGSHTDLNNNVIGGCDIYHDSIRDGNPYDSHGTGVAGVIGAQGNNANGISGVNWNVSLVDMRCGDFLNHVSLDAVLGAFNQLTSMYYTPARVPIINYSIEGYGYHGFIKSAISNFPGLVVWVAGNNNMNTDTLVDNFGSYNLPNLISVGSINSDGTLRDSSNYSQSGLTIDIYAPGGNIITTALNNTFEYMSGTSFAAPHVTGVAALLLSIDSSLTAAQLKTFFCDGAISYTTTKLNRIITLKRLNAIESVYNYLEFKCGPIGRAI